MDVLATFPALKHRNFRLFWFGQVISLVGTWMQVTALQWLVYTLTKSALLLGLLGAAQFGPVMLFSLFAGVFVDRYPKKQMLIFTQSALMAQALILAAFVWFGHVVYWQVLILAIIMGMVNTLDLPARQSYMPDLVGRQDIRSAIGLNSAIVNVARMIGPAISALLIARYNPGLLFFLNGISFIPVIIGLYFIDVNPIPTKLKDRRVLGDVAAGLKYIRKSPVLLGAVLAMLAVGTFVMNFNVIIPIFATQVLHQGVQGYGLLMSASGAGSLVGAILVASAAKGNPRLQLLFGSGIAVSALLLVLYFIHALPFAIATFVVVGFFNIVFITTVNSAIQLNSSNEFRGRVMSVYSFAFAGTTPIGNLFAGSVTQSFGAGIGFMLCGLISLALLGGIIGFLFKERNKIPEQALG
ncbi:MAG: MFS transporter [Peptococcaceae bacterium]|nr:MFS transporter [Peptococcaceae bacterium]